MAEPPGKSPSKSPGEAPAGKTATSGLNGVELSGLTSELSGTGGRAAERFGCAS